MATNLLWRVAIGAVSGEGNGLLSHCAPLAISLACYSAESITYSNLAKKPLLFAEPATLFCFKKLYPSSEIVKYIRCIIRS